MLTGVCLQRISYENRINELKDIPFQERAAGKALPARPESDSSRDLDSTPSLRSSSDDSVIIETASVKRVTNGRLHTIDGRFLAPMEIPRRRESLMPSALDEVEEKFVFSTSPLQYPLEEPSPESAEPEAVDDDDADEEALLSSVDLRMPILESRYMPPPLSPRRPSSPAIPDMDAPPRSAHVDVVLDPERLRPPLDRQHSRAGSTETTSWLDTIDESGGSSASSIRSRVSSMGHRREHVRAASGTTEAEFQAALDAAVEAAYNDGFEAAEVEESANGSSTSEIRTNVETARERVREADREAAILQPKGGETPVSTRSTNHERNGSLEPGAVEREIDDEERLLEEMTRGFVMDDFEYDSQSKSALPRQSDSSTFSGQTWESFIGSNPTTAGTSLQTLAEAQMMPVVSAGSSSKSPPRPPPPLLLPPPGGALPPPPTILSTKLPPPVPSAPPPKPPTTSNESLPQGVRGRRLSSRSWDSLTINIANNYTSAEHSPPAPPLPISRPTDRERIIAPAPLRITSEVPEGRAGTGPPLDPEQTPVPQSPKRKMSTPFPGHNLTGTAPGFLRYLHVESESNGLPASRAGSPSLFPLPSQGENRSVRKNLSSSSLKYRNLSISSPDGSDASPSTPTALTFSNASTNLRKGANPAVPHLPVTNGGSGPGNNLPSGGLHLFDSDIHSPDRPGSPSRLTQDHPVALEPCPTESILRPFWLMRCLYQTIAHPLGGYLSTRMFVPRHAWQVKGVKIKGVEEKVSNCDFLTAALLKLGDVDTCDADAVLEEMQSLEVVLDQVQGNLIKKLGSEVGPQGSSVWLRDSPVGSDQPPTTELGSTKNSISSNKSYLSLKKRLRPKTSGVSLTGALAGPKDSPKEGPGLNSLPMTSDLSARAVRREVTQIQFTGPNAVYMSALARLFDAAQVLGRSLDHLLGLKTTLC